MLKHEAIRHSGRFRDELELARRHSGFHWQIRRRLIALAVDSKDEVMPEQEMDASRTKRANTQRGVKVVALFGLGALCLVEAYYQAFDQTYPNGIVLLIAFLGPACWLAAIAILLKCLRFESSGRCDGDLAVGSSLTTTACPWVT